MYKLLIPPWRNVVLNVAIGPLYLDTAFFVTVAALVVAAVVDDEDVAIRFDVLDNIAEVPSLEEDVAVDTAAAVVEDVVGDRLVVA